MVYHVGALPASEGGVGGASFYLRDLACKMNSLGIATRILCQRDPKPNDLREHAASWLPTWSFGPRAFLDVTQYLRGKRGIVHVQYETALFGSVLASMQLPLLVRIWRAFGFKTVITMHHVIGDDFTVADLRLWKKPQVFDPIALVVLRWIQTAVTKAVDVVIVHELVQQCVLGGSGDARCIPLFVPERRPQGSPPPSDELRVAFFGFLAEYKGVGVLVDAVDRAISRGCKVRLDIVGGTHPRLQSDPDYRGFLQTLERKARSSGGAITLHGFLPDDEADAVIGRCDLMIFPYLATIAASAAVARGIALEKPLAVSTPLAATLQLPEGTLLCGDTIADIVHFFEKTTPQDLARAREISIALREDRSLDRVAAATARVYQLLS